MTVPYDRTALVIALARSGLLFPEFTVFGKGLMFVTEAALLEMIREFNRLKSEK